MSTYNVVRNSRNDGDDPFGAEALPAILEAVLDGEVSASDPRVAEQLRADPDAARRFRHTQRVADRLARNIATPDLSDSILAVVHAKQPFAPRRRPRRVSAHRLAFAGGLLAGIALVVVLQTVARAPRFTLPQQGTPVATLDQAPTTPQPVPTDATPATPRRATQPLAMHGSSKYEASTAPSSPQSSIQVAGLSGNVDVNGRAPVVSILPEFASVDSDPCSIAMTEPSSYSRPVASALVPVDSSMSMVAASSAPEDASTQWPPADIGAFIEQIASCGVGDELAQAAKTH